MHKRLGRTAAAIGVAVGLLVGLSGPAQAGDWGHQRGHDGSSFIKHDRNRWDNGHHGWHPRPDAGPTVIANGLNNPRQLSLPVDQALLIAEAGKGGTTCQGEGEDEACIGDTGSVSVRFLPQRDDIKPTLRIVKNLFSAAGPDGSFATGADGVSHQMGGPIFVVADDQGQLLAARPFRTAQAVAAITAYEQANDPDGQGPDSNPYGVLALRDRVLVADAAANTVFSVNRSGDVSVFHVFPNIVNDVTTTPSADLPGFDPTPDFPGVNFVPTSLAEGPRGEIYVGGLGSEVPGQGEVVRLNRWTGDVEKTWTGFTTVTGVAVGRDHSLYVSQLFAPEAAPINPMVNGVLTKVAWDGTRTDKDVPFPAGVAVDSSNNVYVAAFSVAPDTGLAGSPPGVDTSGQIWRLRF